MAKIIGVMLVAAAVFTGCAEDDAEGTEIEQTFEAIQEAAEVDFDELAAAAYRVEQFAVENCDNVSG